MTDYFRRGNTLVREAYARNHGQFRTTHFLIYEGEVIGELYCYSGQYFTREQFTHGEPGLRRGDLREGEALVKAYTNARSYGE